MRYFKQTDYSQKLGYCTDTIAQSGCFLCSLSMLANIDPLEANEKLKQKGYVQGCLIVDSLAGESLGLEYNGNSNDQPDYPTIAETDYYSNVGVPQHFFVIFTDGTINDPLGGERVPNKYNIVKYHLFKGKEDDMTTEQAKKYIYKATQGHEPSDNEWAWAVGMPIDELVDIRFKDDVVNPIRIAVLNEDASNFEKNHWLNTAKGNKNFHPNDLARQWHNEYIKPSSNETEALQAEIKALKKDNNAQDKIIATMGENENNLNTIIKQKDEQISNCQKDFWTYLKDKIKKIFKK